MLALSIIDSKPTTILYTVKKKPTTSVIDFLKLYNLGGVGFEPTTLSLRGICSAD